jgi:hypothetical protein
MKKSFTLLSFISLSLSSLLSQPILENTIFPIIGDTLDYVSLNNGDLEILPGESGENVTWDFSNFDLTGSTNTVIYKNPNETPLGNNFPSANMAKFYSSDQIEYYRKTNDSLIYLGEKSTGVGLKIYGNSIVDLKAPFNYGDSFTDNFASNFVNGNGASITRTGYVKCSFEAYGSLILPSITIENCIKIKIAQYTRDVQGSTINNYYDTSYYWYSPIIKDHILKYYSTTISGTHYSYAYLQINLNTASISEIVNNSFSIYPNPASQKINITIPTESDFQENGFLLDASGRTIKTFNLTGTKAEIDITDLLSGVYFVRIGNAVEKISVE